MTDLVIRSRNVVTQEGSRPASIHIASGRIERIEAFEDLPSDCPIEECGDLALMAGIVDAHVHVNEPGRTDWEGFETATRAAAAGGITTIVDMPLNSIPPTTSVAALQTKVAALNGKCFVDTGLWGGAVPGNASELQPMLAAGALGFKCFLVDSGVPEFGWLDRDGARSALEALRDTDAPLLFHAEVAEPIEAAAEHLHGASSSYDRYVRSRPPLAEDQAIAMVTSLAEVTGARAHVVHLSSAAAVPIISAAQGKGVRISAETTPHYLFFAAEQIPDGRPEYKCAPPIRELSNREELWEGLKSGTISSVVSDHSPCTPDLKHLDSGDVEHAWGGIASLQLSLPIVWTEASRRGYGLHDITRLMSRAPARLAGLDDRKGELAAGFDADLVVFDADAMFTVDREQLQHRNKITPYHGHELRGVVKTTYLRGIKVWENGAHRGGPAGTWLKGRNSRVSA